MCVRSISNVLFGRISINLASRLQTMWKMDSFVRRWMGRAEKGKHIFRSRQLTIHKIFIRNKTTVYGQSTIFYVYESLTWCVSGGRIFFYFRFIFSSFLFLFVVSFVVRMGHCLVLVAGVFVFALYLLFRRRTICDDSTQCPFNTVFLDSTRLHMSFLLTERRHKASDNSSRRGLFRWSRRNKKTECWNVSTDLHSNGLYKYLALIILDKSVVSWW